MVKNEKMRALSHKSRLPDSEGPWSQVEAIYFLGSNKSEYLNISFLHRFNPSWTNKQKVAILKDQKPPPPPKKNLDSGKLLIKTLVSLHNYINCIELELNFYYKWKLLGTWCERTDQQMDRPTDWVDHI